MKVKHTWSKYDTVFVRYEDDSVDKINSQWYFLIDDTPRNRDFIKTVKGLGKVSIEGKYIRIEYVHKDSAQLILWLDSKGIKTYEADLLPDKRWYIDNKVEIANNFTKLYYDIETDDSSDMIEVGKDRILSFAAIDNSGKIYFETIKDETDESEKELLKKFLKISRKYNVLLGWNTSGFDRPYLKARMSKYELNRGDAYCWKEFAHYDLLKRFRHIFRFDSHIKSFALDYVAKHFLEKGKIEHTEKIIELYRNNKPKLKEYNIEDCILVKELDEKLGVSDMMIRQSQWCGVPPAQFGLYSIIDSYILKKAHSIGERCPTSLKAIQERDYDNVRSSENPDDTETEKSKYMGAIVLDPKIGKYDNVYTFDFKGLYPSLMRTSNIGYDSLRYVSGDNSIVNPGTIELKRLSGVVKPTYFVKIPSVINLAISDLITKRGEYKDLKLKMIEDGTNKGKKWERVVSDEIIVKELANSTYGIMGLDYGRYFSIDVAESITLFGQWCILFAKRHYESLGYEVIYGDTDSVFVSTGRDKLDIDVSLRLFHEKLKLELKDKYNIDQTFIQLNFDKLYDSFILIAKKTYVGHVINIEGKKTNDTYARGLEYHKKNTFSYAATKQKELIEMILKGTDRESVKLWSNQTRDEFFSRDFSREELTITQKVGKAVHDYKSPPLHVRLAQVIKEETGENLRHHEIDYIITDGSKGMNGIMASKFDGKFDRSYYWENKTLPIITRVLEVVYPGFDVFCTNLTLF